ncbi:hypothetical protein ACUY4Q_004975 (plasmid) [Phytobacter sp. AG2a]|jgi:hypothetical protein
MELYGSAWGNERSYKGMDRLDTSSGSAVCPSRRKTLVVRNRMVSIRGGLAIDP